MIPIAYLFMAGGLVSFAAMGIIHKLGDRSGAHPLGLTLIAMGTAALASLASALLFQGSAMRTVPWVAILIAIPFGASAAMGLWFFQQGLRHGRIATSWLLINLSAGIPTVLSLLFYHEPLTWRKAGVFALVVASLFLLWWDRRERVEEKA
jgi:drug/metabolite transporter (DMT)-like permease